VSLEVAEAVVVAAAVEAALDLVDHLEAIAAAVVVRLATVLPRTEVRPLDTEAMATVEV
jgi:hypothetical protein